MRLNFDRETIQLEDLIEGHGLDPYVDPDVAQAASLFQAWIQSPSALSATAVPSPPARAEELQDNEQDELMGTDSETQSELDSPAHSEDEVSSPGAAQHSSPQDDKHAFASSSESFEPVIREIRRVRLYVSPPGPRERAIFDIDSPTSSISGQLSDG